MTCKKCRDAFKWLDSLGQHYQPIYGFEEEYVDKGKINKERVWGFNEIFKTIQGVTGDATNKRILDIGSNLGWFCFQFDSWGADCIGLEIDKNRVEVCNAIKDKMGLKDHPTFYAADAKEWLKENSTIKFDYVIILNTIHHMFVQDEKATWEMFNDLLDRSRGIFIMMRSGMKGWKLKYSNNIPRSIIEQSDANEFISLGRVHGRTIYFFSKNLEKTEEIPTTPTKL